MSAPAFRSVPELVAWLERAPAGTRLEASEVASILAALAPGADDAPRAPEGTPDPSTWRERLWTVPAETRLGVSEMAEALGRPRSYVYARTGKAENPIPHRKLDGAVIATAGELRAWIRAHEHVVAAGPMDTPPQLRSVRGGA